MSSTISKCFWRGFRDGLPFLLVVGPFSVLFGVVAAEAGLNVIEALSFSVVVIAGAALLWYARGTDFAAPPWVKARIDARLAQELPDLAIAFDDLTLSVSDSYQPSLHLTDMRIRTAAGGDQIVLSDVTGSFDKAALLEGQVRPRVISVTGARIHVSRDANGRVGVAFGADQNAPPALAGGLDAAQTMGAISTLLDRPAFAKLRRIEGANLIVQYEDRQAGRSWIVDGGVLGLSRDGEALKLNGNFALLGGHAFATTIELAVNAHAPDRAGRAGPGPDRRPHPL